MLTSQSHGYTISIYVSRAGVPLPPPGTEACLTGVYRRRDGLTREEAEARGLTYCRLDHGFVSFCRVFHPTAVEVTAATAPPRE